MHLVNSTIASNWIFAATNLLVVFGGGLKVYLTVIKKLDRIEYAIFNDGNGMKQQVQDLHSKQAEIKIDLEVMKSKLDQPFAAVKRRAPRVAN